ncbi:MAG: hypothetical protein GY810_01435 [Aureispira sp.]|nr:hypothetical protein [Aureispira sp.]
MASPNSLFTRLILLVTALVTLITIAYLDIRYFDTFPLAIGGIKFIIFGIIVPVLVGLAFTFLLLALYKPLLSPMDKEWTTLPAGIGGVGIIIMIIFHATGIRDFWVLQQRGAYEAISVSEIHNNGYVSFSDGSLEKEGYHKYTKHSSTKSQSGSRNYYYEDFYFFPVLNKQRQASSYILVISTCLESKESKLPSLAQVLEEHPTVLETPQGTITVESEELAFYQKATNNSTAQFIAYTDLTYADLLSKYRTRALWLLGIFGTLFIGLFIKFS